MKANKAYKFRIYPTNSQAILIHKTFGCTRLVYNKMLKERKDYYEQTGKSLTGATGYAKFKDEFEFLKEVDSQALAQEWNALNAAYRNFFNGKAGFPKFKSKKSDRKSYTTSVSNKKNPAQRFENGKLKLPKLGLVKTKIHRFIPDDYELKSVTISYTSSGKYYASVLYEYEQEIADCPTENIIGLDFSMSELYVDSNGNQPNYPRYYRQGQKKLAKLQRQLSKMAKGSNNYHKQRRKVARYHEHVSNSRKDFLHKQSRQITNVCDAVVVEDLNMKNMSRSLRFGKSVHDNGWGMFTAFLSYKLHTQGKRLVKIDKWFPSSKMCFSCGELDKGLELKDRVYRCGCGHVIDRDLNAALNIKREGERILASS